MVGTCDQNSVERGLGQGRDQDRRQIKAEHIPAVFMENITDHRLLDQIARETGAKIGGELYTDGDGPLSVKSRLHEVLIEVWMY
jgi:hypothetical protein